MIGRVAAHRSLSGEYWGCKINAPKASNQATGSTSTRRINTATGEKYFDSASNNCNQLLKHKWVEVCFSRKAWSKVFLSQTTDQNNESDYTTPKYGENEAVVRRFYKCKSLNRGSEVLIWCLADVVSLFQRPKGYGKYLGLMSFQPPQYAHLETATFVTFPP